MLAFLQSRFIPWGWAYFLSAHFIRRPGQLTFYVLVFIALGIEEIAAGGKSSSVCNGRQEVQAPEAEVENRLYGGKY